MAVISSGGYYTEYTGVEVDSAVKIALNLPNYETLAGISSASGSIFLSGATLATIPQVSDLVSNGGYATSGAAATIASTIADSKLLAYPTTVQVSQLVSNTITQSGGINAASASTIASNIIDSKELQSSGGVNQQVSAYLSAGGYVTNVGASSIADNRIAASHLLDSDTIAGMIGSGAGIDAVTAELMISSALDDYPTISGASTIATNVTSDYLESGGYITGSALDDYPTSDSAVAIAEAVVAENMTTINGFSGAIVLQGSGAITVTSSQETGSTVLVISGQEGSGGAVDTATVRQIANEQISSGGHIVESGMMYNGGVFVDQNVSGGFVEVFNAYGLDTEQSGAEIVGGIGVSPLLTQISAGVVSATIDWTQKNPTVALNGSLWNSDFIKNVSYTYYSSEWGGEAGATNNEEISIDAALYPYPYIGGLPLNYSGSIASGVFIYNMLVESTGAVESNYVYQNGDMTPNMWYTLLGDAYYPWTAAALTISGVSGGLLFIYHPAGAYAEPVCTALVTPENPYFNLSAGSTWVVSSVDMSPCHYELRGTLTGMVDFSAMGLRSDGTLQSGGFISSNMVSVEFSPVSAGIGGQFSFSGASVEHYVGPSSAYTNIVSGGGMFLDSTGLMISTFGESARVATEPVASGIAEAVASDVAVMQLSAVSGSSISIPLFTGGVSYICNDPIGSLTVNSALFSPRTDAVTFTVADSGIQLSLPLNISLIEGGAVADGTVDLVAGSSYIFACNQLKAVIVPYTYKSTDYYAPVNGSTGVWLYTYFGNRFASQLAFSGMWYSSGIGFEKDQVLYVYSRGAFINGFLEGGKGSAIIYTGGSATNVSVLAGRLIAAGGTLRSNTVYAASVDVSSGGVAYNTIVSGKRPSNQPGVVSGFLRVHSGAIASGASVAKYGEVFVYSGGTAYDVNIPAVYAGLNGFHWFSSTLAIPEITDGVCSVGENLIFTGTTLTVMSGAALDPVALRNSESYLVISNGGVANRTIIYKGSALVETGGVINVPAVGAEYYSEPANPPQLILAGGTAISAFVTLNNGLIVSNQGVAESTAVSARGTMTVMSGGTATDTVLTMSGILAVNSGGIASDIQIVNGDLLVLSGGSAYNVALSSGGYILGFRLDSAQQFDSVTPDGLSASGGLYISNNTLYVSSEAVYNNPIILSATTVSVKPGGSATNVGLRPGGYLVVSSGFISGVYPVLKGPAGLGFIYAEGGVLTDISASEGSLAIYLSAGATASNVMLDGPTVLFIESGGIASGVTISSAISGGGARLHVYSGGTALAVRRVYAPGAHYNWTITVEPGGTITYV